MHSGLIIYKSKCCSTTFPATPRLP